MLPKISIVIPTFNVARYLEETLGSIFSQNYSNIEVIIEDGGSTDGTVDIIEKYAKKYPRIIKWVSKKDKGQVDAINKGLSKATGEIVTYINGDDVYKPNAFLIVGKYFSKRPNILWLAGRGDIIDSNGKQISKLVTIYKNMLLQLNKFWLLLIVDYFTQPAVFLSRKAYQRDGSFWGPKNYVMEYELWLKMGKDKMPEVTISYLASFRLTKENKSSSYYNTLLPLDYEIAMKYTKNPVILFLHWLNNLGRVFFSKLIK